MADKGEQDSRQKKEKKKKKKTRMYKETRDSGVKRIGNCTLRDGRVDSREGWGGEVGTIFLSLHAYKGVRIFAFWFVLK